ncbi:MAG TPA: CHAP domain-containing protein [Ktedonobacteraceae bacterium]
MSSTSENRQSSLVEGLQIPGLVQDQEPVEQLSFTANPATPAPASYQQEPLSSPDLADCDTVRQAVPRFEVAAPLTPVPGTTRALLMQSQPAVTQALEQLRSNSLPLRSPVVIQSTYARSEGLPRPPQGRRHVIGIAALVLLLVITGGTLFAVSPLGREAGLGFNPFLPGSSIAQGGPDDDLRLVAQQATATAVVHQQNDGFDPNAGTGGAVVTGGPVSWPLGVCTYWANLRYHQLTGIWVTWRGNAYQWADGARAAGWHVSQTPHVPSIIVLMPGVQGASGYGHVAVVESASGNTVHTSNMNWYANGGGWDRVSYYDFSAGSGIYFIWD